MLRNPVLVVALLVTLSTPACGVGCEVHHDIYSGADSLPHSLETAEQLLAESRISLVDERPWPTADEQGTESPLLPLPYEGLTQFEIEVMPLTDKLRADYIYESEYGCEPNAPEAPVRITIRTSDGVLNEEVEGTLSAGSGHAHVSATITEPKGRIKEYFDGYPSSIVPKLSVEIDPGHARLEVVLEQIYAGGASYDYITLL